MPRSGYGVGVEAGRAGTCQQLTITHHIRQLKRGSTEQESGQAGELNCMSPANSHLNTRYSYVSIWVTGCAQWRGDFQPPTFHGCR